MGPALETVWTVVGQCVDFVTENSILMTIFCASLIPIGFKIFKRAKRSVR